METSGGKTSETRAAGADTRRAVDEANAALMRFAKSQDANGMASLYSEDATFIAPTGEVMTGRAAIAEHWRQSIAAGLCDADLHTVSLTEMGGQHACEIGTYRIRIEDPKGGSISPEGTYVVLWKRAADGRWWLHVDAPLAA